MCEIPNGCFVDAQAARARSQRAAAPEKSDGPVWVVHDPPAAEKAVIQVASIDSQPLVINVGDEGSVSE